MDGSRTRKEKIAFPNENGYVWTGPKSTCYNAKSTYYYPRAVLIRILVRGVPPGSLILTLFHTKNVIFYTRFQTWGPFLETPKTNSKTAKTC